MTGTEEGSGLPPRYEVRSSLGKGGMGRVFLCYDTVLDALVAIKVLAPHLLADNEAVESMRNEARAVFKFHDCSGILRLHTFDQHQGNWFLVMEFAEGGSLEGRLKKEGRLPEAEVRRLGAEVADALDFAHRHHVLHRDIKPGNILLDRAGRVKVGDFGIAKLMEGSSTMTMSITGTPPYMSPESILRATMDRRTDQYSLGCMLFEMAAGRRPYVGSQQAIFEAKLSPEARLPDVRDLAPDVSEGLSAIIRRSMALLPDERFPSCADLAAALREGAAPAPPPEDGGATITRSTADFDGPTARPAATQVRGAATVPVASVPGAATVMPAPAAAPAKSRLPLVLGAAGVLAAAGIAFAIFSGGEEPGKPAASTDAAGAKPPEPAAKPGPAPSDGPKEPAPSPGPAAAPGPGSGEPEKRTAPSTGEPTPKPPEKPVESPVATPAPAPKEPAPPAPKPPEKPPFEPAVADLPPPPESVLTAQRALSSLPKGFHRDTDGRIWCDADGAEMVLVSAGEFTMGSDDGEADEKPAHSVRLPDYLIDRHEVTVKQYRAFCTDAGKTLPEQPLTPDQPEAGNPVVAVPWQDAAAYARWAKKELPTEAQWEKAARGTDGRRYPWGSGEKKGACNAKGSGDIYRGLSPVGAMTGDVSPYGCFDMAGNVSEWCTDWYSADSYASHSAEDPRGPEEGDARVYRGGNWFHVLAVARAGIRQQQSETIPRVDLRRALGFRCVRRLP